MTSAVPGLAITPLRLTLRSHGLGFPGFSGSLWHGGLGKMLERHFRPAFDMLYGAEGDARLYALLPPVTDAIPPDQLFELRLTLFGPATRHALACTQAIAHLGSAGLGPAGRFHLEAAAVSGPTGDTQFFTAADGLLNPPPTHDVRGFVKPRTSPNRLRIHLTTPLRLKAGNDLLRTGPRYEQLIQRLFGRMDQIAFVAGVEPPLAKNGRQPLLEEARKVQAAAQDVRWVSLDRRSARSGQQMAFGGLMGTLEYLGDFSTTLPWLQVGRWLQVGGKPAFGFGGMDVELPH